MALNATDLQAIVELIRRDPEARRQIQAALEIDGLLELPGRMAQVEEALRQLTALVADLAAAQRRTDERLAELAAAQRRTEETLRSLTQEVQKVSGWQFGEDGRHQGEQYERRIQLTAFNLLQRGDGGPPAQRHVAERLQAMLQRLPAGEMLEDEENPFLADLIWWKDDPYVVVEISLRVDRTDVIRAARRAETLQRTDANVTAVVIGEERIAGDTEDLAKARSVEWKVGGDLSPGFVVFRRLSA